MADYGHIIDGAEVDSLDGATFETIDPWTQQPWGSVALGAKADAERAVAAARTAFDEGPWPRMGYQERAGILNRFAALIEDNAAELGQADTRDMGKPITQSRDTDVRRTAQNFRFFAEHAKLSTGEALPMDSGHHAYSLFQPAGVVAAIAPWNYPMMMESWKVAPALAWGNTVVLKPAEDTPVSATLLGRLAIDAGVPAGVFNVVHGYGPDSVGEALTLDNRVDRITFTGESSTGRVITQAAATHLAPVSLELGGKGANLVFDDADLDNAVTWAIKAIFTNTGQICLAGSRLYVQRGIYDRFLDAFVAAAEAMHFGNPMEEGTQIGPLASKAHYDKVVGFLNGVERDGGKILTGGRGEHPWSVRPTVVVDVAADSRIQRDEVFGPLVTVTPFDEEAEAVRLANDTRFGLNAMLFTENLSRAHRVAAQLRAGTVWVNCFFIRDLRAPFGGVGDSGLGREGGNFSREFFTEPKAVVMQIAR
jgi:aminomuconate-semialdehyde/2-hydroxymuconate-6-semialdehyde dehydrogenase